MKKQKISCPVLRPLDCGFVFKVGRRMPILVACLVENFKMGS